MCMRGGETSCCGKEEKLEKKRKILRGRFLGAKSRDSFEKKRAVKSAMRDGVVK